MDGGRARATCPGGGGEAVTHARATPPTLTAVRELLLDIDPLQCEPVGQGYAYQSLIPWRRADRLHRVSPRTVSYDSVYDGSGDCCGVQGHRGWR